MNPHQIRRRNSDIFSLKHRVIVTQNIDESFRDQQLHCISLLLAEIRSRDERLNDPKRLIRVRTQRLAAGKTVFDFDLVEQEAGRGSTDVP